jgi:hypothetical protein
MDFLGIAVPNGMENGIFQLVKVALSSIVALFGTYQIAANGVVQSSLRSYRKRKGFIISKTYQLAPKLELIKWQDIL